MSTKRITMNRETLTVLDPLVNDSVNIAMSRTDGFSFSASIEFMLLICSKSELLAQANLTKDGKYLEGTLDLSNVTADSDPLPVTVALVNGNTKEVYAVGKGYFYDIAQSSIDDYSSSSSEIES